MTTSPVASISDDTLADLEACASGEAPRWHSIVIMKVTIADLIARLRAAEKDAARYRWLRDKAVDASGTYPMVSMTDDCGDQVSNWLFGRGMETAIDEAMEQQP